MKKYQIYEKTAEQNHAGSKAVTDVYKVALRLGYTPVTITMQTLNRSLWGKVVRQVRWLHDWFLALLVIERNSIVLLQNPFHHKQINRDIILIFLKKWKNIKFISIIHDVEELRGDRFDEYYKNEFQMMRSLSDVVIVHNDVMKQWFIKKGVSEEKIVVLRIFDYLRESSGRGSVIFSRRINIAGNMDISKSKYVYSLEQVPDVEFTLFGPNYRGSRAPNVEHRGSLNAKDLELALESGFGLVWDGDSIDTCAGKTGNYLRYNSPHKLSLYLALGLPVIIWSEAAQAEFVIANKVGICVNSLKDLGEAVGRINEEDYECFRKHCDQLSLKLSNGVYTEAALVTAQKKLENTLDNVG